MAKKKIAIQDRHLMMFVLAMVLVDVIILSSYTLLEGVVDKFGVLRVPNREKLSAVSGVRLSKLSLEVVYHTSMLSTGTRNNHNVLH